MNDSVKKLSAVADRIYEDMQKKAIANTYLLALLAVAYRNLDCQEKYRILESQILANLREDGSFDHSDMTITCTSIPAILSRFPRK